MMKISEAAKYPNLATLRIFYKKHRSKIYLFLIFTILSGIISLASPLVISQLLIKLTNGSYREMVDLAILLFVLVAAVAATGMISEYYYSVTSKDIFFDMRHEITKKTISMNLSSVYDKGSGFFLERMNEDSREASVVHLNIWKAVISLVINIGFIGYITVLNMMLGLLFALGLVVLVFLEYLRVNRLLINMKRSKRAIENVKTNEAEILKGIKEIKGLDAKDPIIDKHSELSSKFADIKYEREMFQKKMQTLIDAVKGVIDLSVILFAGLYLLPNGMVELAAVLIIYTYKGNIYALISGVARIKDTYVNGELSAKRINDIINAPKEEIDRFGDIPLNNKINSMDFRNVSFGYSKDKIVIDDINFTIEGNGMTGFVGKSGGGKSTIFGLISKFHDPTYGKILINGTEMDRFKEDDIRGKITPVLQDPYIFNDTVKNNLLLASPNASNDNIEKACRAAGIHDEIVAMENGYDTIIGENGATISGGQKQRIEIARVLLKDPDVLLFDEATSALDKTNLERINDLMTELKKSKMILVIAHRMSIMKRCDNVIVIDDGKIVAIGTHDELMVSSERYRELLRRSATAETNT